LEKLAPMRNIKTENNSENEALRLGCFLFISKIIWFCFKNEVKRENTIYTSRLKIVIIYLMNIHLDSDKFCRGVYAL